MLLIKVLLNKAFNFVFQSFKKEEITLPHEFIIVFIRYLIRAVLSKSVNKSRLFGKKIKRGDGFRGGFKPSRHFGIERDQWHEMWYAAEYRSAQTNLTFYSTLTSILDEKSNVGWNEFFCFHIPVLYSVQHSVHHSFKNSKWLTKHRLQLLL